MTSVLLSLMSNQRAALSNRNPSEEEGVTKQTKFEKYLPSCVLSNLVLVFSSLSFPLRRQTVYLVRESFANEHK